MGQLSRDEFNILHFLRLLVSSSLESVVSSSQPNYLSLRCLPWKAVVATFNSSSQNFVMETSGCLHGGFSPFQLQYRAYSVSLKDFWKSGLWRSNWGTRCASPPFLPVLCNVSYWKHWFLPCSALKFKLLVMLRVRWILVFLCVLNSCPALLNGFSFLFQPNLHLEVCLFLRSCYLIEYR